MKVFSKLRLGMLAPFIAVVFGAVLFGFNPLPLQVLKNAVFDQYQRWHPRPYQALPVRIIDIDEESLKRLGQWPWPRTRMSDLIERLRQAGAAVISLDIVFAEKDRTSPQTVSAAWNLPDDVRRRLSSLPDHDAVFAEAVSKGRVVLGFATKQDHPAQPLPVQPSRFVFSGPSPLPFLYSFAGTVSSLPAFQKAAAGQGALTFVPDPDGVVRRIPLIIRVQDRIMPSLAAESLRIAQDGRNYIVKTGGPKGVGIQEIRIGKITAPTTPQGEIWVHYTPSVPDRYIPAWKILAGKIPAKQVEGHIILIGTSAQGLMDLRFSPLGTIIPGVEVHAQALEQMLTNHYLTRPSWAEAIEAMVIVFAGIVIGIISLAAPALISAGITVLVLLGAGWGAWTAFTGYGLLLDALTPALAILLTFIVGSIVHHRTSERRQRWVREAFSRYVSPNRVKYLVDHPDQLELGGRRQECSFIFTDLAGFTTLMENQDPGKAVAILNAYLDQMITIAFRYGGTLDRIVGDAVAIMFSAPVLQPDHRNRALACALDMHTFATSYANDFNARGIPFGQTRIGIHTGEVIVGNFGGSTMFDYRALGDVVNTAARLESVNKHLGTLICVSEETLSGCPEAVVRPVGSLILKGKTRPLTVYEPITQTNTPNGKPKRDLDYEKAFELLRQNDPQALDAFEKLAEERPQDPLVGLHLKRLQSGEQGDTIILEEK